MSNSAQVSAKASSLVIRSAIVAAVGGLIFGFDTAVISGANAALKKQFHLDDGGLGATVAIATVGTIIGALIGGRSADRFGRRKLLFFIGILYVLGALGTALAPSHLVLMIFRFIGGIGVGLSSVCAPIYTAEIAPARVRGRLVGLLGKRIEPDDARWIQEAGIASGARSAHEDMIRRRESAALAALNALRDSGLALAGGLAMAESLVFELIGRVS